MAERITDKDPAVKLARKRLSVLELAQELGSITKACKGERQHEGQAGGEARSALGGWQRERGPCGIVLSSLFSKPAVRIVAISNQAEGGTPIVKVYWMMDAIESAFFYV